MIEFLKLIIEIMYRIHRSITQLNDNYQINMTDKQLHFWVFGFVCIIMFIVIHFMFKWIAKHSIIALSFIYTFTVAVVLAFAIEIGQYQSKTGHMEFADILYGLYGFVMMFVFGLITVLAIRYLMKKLRN